MAAADENDLKVKLNYSPTNNIETGNHRNGMIKAEVKDETRLCANDTSNISQQHTPPPPPPPPPPSVTTSHYPTQEMGKSGCRMSQKELRLKLVPAIEKNELSTVLHMLKEGLQPDCIVLFNKTPLTYAIELGNFNIAMALISSGADVNANEPTGSRRQALHIAVNYINVDVLPLLAFLVKHGANVDVRDRSGATPVMVASYIGRLDIVQFLQSHGADLEAADYVGRTALHRAAEGQHRGIIRFLLANGARIDARDMFGWTAIYHSIVFGDVDTMKLLIECGIPVNGIDRNNRSPLIVACNRLNTNNISLVLASAFDYDKRMRKIPTSAVHSVLNCGNGTLLEFTLVKLLINVGARLHTTWLTLTDLFHLCPNLKVSRKHVILHYLLLAGCLRQQKAIDMHSIPSAMLSLWMREQSSLRHLCRFAIRTHLAVQSQCRDIKGAIMTLPVPLPMKDFLSLSDFTDMYDAGLFPFLS